MISLLPTSEYAISSGKDAIPLQLPMEKIEKPVIGYIAIYSAL